MLTHLVNWLFSRSLQLWGQCQPAHLSRATSAWLGTYLPPAWLGTCSRAPVKAGSTFEAMCGRGMLNMSHSEIRFIQDQYSGARASTSFCTVSHGFPSPAPLLTRRAACGVLFPVTMLIGACDPMLRPIHVFRDAHGLRLQPDRAGGLGCLSSSYY